MNKQNGYSLLIVLLICSLVAMFSFSIYLLNLNTYKAELRYRDSQMIMAKAKQCVANDVQKLEQHHPNNNHAILDLETKTNTWWTAHGQKCSVLYQYSGLWYKDLSTDNDYYRISIYFDNTIILQAMLQYNTISSKIFLSSYYEN